MAWDNKYKLGILWQDVQHEQLVDHLAMMVKAREEGMEDAVYFRTLEFLERYIQDHFSMEAHYMKKYNYPKIYEHLNEHKIFNNDFLSFKHSCDSSDDSDCSKGLMIKLSKWIIKHIMKTDKELTEFLLEKGVEAKVSV